MTTIKAVLFDMDGVLVEAKEWHYEALNRALDLFGMAISRVDHETTFDGLPTSRKLEMLSVERGLPRELHSFLNEMKLTAAEYQTHSLTIANNHYDKDAASEAKLRVLVDFCDAYAQWQPDPAILVCC